LNERFFFQAFTGSATPLLIKSLVESLDLGSSFKFQCIQGKFTRRELVWGFRPMHSFQKDLIQPIEALLQRPWSEVGSMVIYVRGPKECDQVRDALADLWKMDENKREWMNLVEIVNSPLSDDHREQCVQHLNSGRLRVIIATVCLGMVIFYGIYIFRIPIR
jgi:superfamily II DNA helicase RecQ